jgi:hypothetical protein
MSSMFSSRTQSDVKVQVGPGETEFEVVTIRKLSGVSLDKAQEAKRIDAIQTVKAYGAELLGLARGRAEELKERIAERKAQQPAPVVIPEAVIEPEPETEEAKAKRLKERQEARYEQYDRQLVLQAGIVRWTVKDASVNPDNIADLDADIANQLHRAILDLSLPAVDVEDARSKS